MERSDVLDDSLLGDARECEVSFAAGSVRCRVARKFLARLRGMLGVCPGAWGCEGLLLVPCGSIHTFGMAFPIDVAFLDRAGVVRDAARGVPPGRLVSSRLSCAVMERQASADAWPEVGDTVRIAVT